MSHTPCITASNAEQKQVANILKGNKEHTVAKIISGGQTGVDTIGLQVGKELGIPTGGTAPKGFARESGIDTEDISSYGLVEITDSEQLDYTKRTGKKDLYTARTELNVRNSDGTVYFSTSADSLGLIATKRAAKEWNKPFIENPTAEQLRNWIQQYNIKVINIAGNRGSKLTNGEEIRNTIKTALTTNSTEKLTNQDEKINAEFQDWWKSVGEAKYPLADGQDIFMDGVLENHPQKEQILKDFANRNTKGINPEFVERKVNGMHNLHIDFPTAAKRKEAYETTAYYINLAVSNYLANPDNQGQKPSLEDLKDIVKAMILKGNDMFKQTLAKNISDSDREYIENMLQQREALYNNIEALYPAASALYKMYYADITQVAKINDSSVVIEEETETTDTNNENPQDDISPKDSYEDTFGKQGIESFANSLTKQILTQMVVRKEDGSVVKNAFGVPKKVPSAQVYGQLCTWLKGVTSQQEMIEKLTEKSKTPHGYWLKGLLGLVSSSNNAADIKNSLFVTFNKSNVNYAIFTTGNDSRVYLKNFLESDSEIVLAEALRFQIQEVINSNEKEMPKKTETIFNADKETAQNIISVAIENINDLLKDPRNDVDENKKDYVNALSGLFNTVGISLPQEVLEDIVNHEPTSEEYTLGKNRNDNRKKFISAIKDSFAKISKYVVSERDYSKPFDYTELRQYIEELSREIGRKILVEVQRSTKIGADVMFNDVNNSFILTQKKLLFDSKDYFDNWIKPYMFKDPWYNKNYDAEPEEGNFNPYIPILKDIMDGRGSEYTRVIVRKNENDKEYQIMTRGDILAAEWSGYISGYDYANEGTKEQWGYFKDGLFGDSSKFIFMKMRVYSANEVMGHLAEIVNQEYRRILYVEKKINARNNGKHIRLTAAEKKNGLKFNFFPELNSLQFFKYNIEKMSGIQEPKAKASEKISFKEALDILADNPSVFESFIKHELYNEDKNYEGGILGKIIAKDYRVLRESRYSELTCESARLMPAYNEKYGFYKNGDTLFDINPLEPFEKEQWLTVSELKAYKKKATSEIQTVKEALKNKENQNENSIKLEKLNKIVKAIDRDISRNIAGNAKKFLYNRILNSIQLLELRDKDLAYFKGFNDYIKRSKQAAGDYVSPNVDAPVHNTKTAQRVLVVNDPMYKTDEETLKVINAVIDKAVSNKSMTPQAAKYFKKTWANEITQTDGQMMRTPIAKRDLDIMLALPESTGIVDKIYDAVISDRNPSDEEFKNAGKIIAFMKEYCYSIPAANGYAPTQLKNGTTVLNAANKNGGIYSKADKLKALQAIAEAYGYDAIVFASGMKVGAPVKEDMIDLNVLNGKESLQEMVNALQSEIQSKPLATIDGIEYKFMGEQTKERNFDMENASMTIGTQLTKIVPSILKNISGTVNIAGKELTGKEAFTLYQAAAVLEKISDWNLAKKVFADKRDLNAKLKGGITTSKKFSSELIEALDADELGNTLIPYNDITIRGSFEDKLLAFGRKTLPKILASSLGDHLYVASDYGFEGKDKLQVVYENEKLKYVECYIPLIYKDLLEDCLVTDDGGKTFSLDKGKLYKKYPKGSKIRRRVMELFDIVGYRVPTEGMCSIIPLRIKGFLPLTNQGNIILPAEMIKRTGHDMDGDEIFILKRASMKYSKNQFLRDNGLENASEEEQDKAWSEVEAEYANTVVNKRYRITDALKNALRYGDMETVFKEMSEMNDDQKHNLIVDLILATCRSEEGTIEGVRVSTFEDVSRTAKLIKYINLLDFSKNTASEIERIKKLLDSTSEEMDSLLDSVESKADNPMSLSASLDATEEAIAGKKFLGIFAVGKAVGAITMCTDTEIIDGPMIAGKQLKRLSLPVQDSESVSANNGQAVAACPDNSKDPTVLAFGVNDVTKNIIQLMMQGGYDLQTIGLLMNQPIVKQIVRRITNFSDSPNPKASIVSSTLDSIRKGLEAQMKTEIKLTADLRKQILNGTKINTNKDSLLSNIILAKAGMQDKLEQYYIGVLFSELANLAEKYSDRGRNLRGDSGSGNLDTSIEGSMKRVQMTEDYVEKSRAKSYPIRDNFPIVNANYTPSKFDSDVDIFKEIMRSSFPISYSQYAIGLRGYLGLMADIYPEISPAWKESLFKTRNYSKKNFKVNDLYSFLWHRKMQRNQNKSRAEVMLDTIIKTPKKLQEMKDNPDYKNNAFIKDLGIKYRKIGDTDTKIPVIFSYSTNAQGRISSGKLQEVIDGWKSLAEDDNPATRGFARQMFMYFLYVYGNTWKPGSLAFVRPNNLVLQMSNYREALEEMKQAPDMQMKDNYDKQSVVNHLAEYAVNAPDSLFEKLKIDRESVTLKELKEAFKNGIITEKGLPIIKIETKEGNIYLKDYNPDANNSDYRIIESKSANLEGLLIVNMDYKETADTLVDIQAELIRRAEEARIATKAEKDADAYAQAQEADWNATQAAIEKGAPDDTEYWSSVSDDELIDNEPVRNPVLPVSNVEDNKDDSGKTVDSEGNPKC